jgi:hypothetical protein
MITHSKTKIKVIRAAGMAFIFLAASAYSYTSHAQSFRPFKYMGFEGTFGVRSFKLESSITQLDRMAVVVAGGSLGVVFGNDILRTQLRGGGFYCSTSSVPRTVDFYESEALFNFYPLEFLRKNENAIDIYLVGGISLDNIKFYGHYLSPEDKKINYSSDEPYLGKLTQVQVSGGLGLEYQLIFNGDFVHFFAEARLGTAIYSAADRQPFENTSTSGIGSLNVGMSFGLYR